MTSLVTILWSMETAVVLTVAALCGLVWTIDRRNLAYLALCVVAVAVAALGRTEVGMLHAVTNDAYRDWLRLSQVPLFLIIVGQLLFVQLYVGTGRRWLLLTAIGARTLVLGRAFLADPNLDWGDILSLAHTEFLGESVTIPGSVSPSYWDWLAVGSCVLAVIFVADAALRGARQGRAEERRKALIAACSIGLPLAVCCGYWHWALLGQSPLPLFATPSFLITILVLGVELSRGLLMYRQTRQELENLRSELARAGRVTALGQLASALAHELSQPLGAILRNAEAAEIHLSRPSVNLDELRAIIADIRSDDRRAGNVIDQMRALIKRRTLEMHPIALNDLVRDVISLLRSDAMERRVALDFVVASGLPLISGDRVHLSQVLLNLIINGMDAIEESQSRTKRVVIEARREAHGRIEVAITDSGTGIPPEAIDKVFDSFYTTKSSGLGMGLPISRTIVEAHGGRLWAERAASGRGLTFRFTLREAEEAA